jgi:DNA-binding NarL/FixJ family response regulator
VSIRVIVAEDDYLMREGIRRVLESAPDVTVVAECGDGEELLAAIDREEPDVVVTDIRMPPSDVDEGIRIANRLRRTHPQVGVLVLSQFVEPEYALALLEGGSDRRAYLLKERVHDRQAIVSAVRAVAAGGSAFDAKVVDGLVAARGGGASSPLKALSPRELEVLGEVAQARATPPSPSRSCSPRARSRSTSTRSSPSSTSPVPRTSVSGSRPRCSSWTGPADGRSEQRRPEVLLARYRRAPRVRLVEGRRLGRLRGDQQDRDPRRVCSDPLRGVQPADARHSYVHDHEVRRMIADERDRLLARARLADPSKAGDHLDDAPRDLAKRRLVVDGEHQDVAWRHALGRTFRSAHQSSDGGPPRRGCPACVPASLGVARLPSVARRVAKRG